ncbi:hypothetical protein F4818DRAFT_437493 [Hypoxylon cercidicola]|nr:hypothetical protein F4818DRAFT_437493 [Hypoxylon cercidicola]
MTPKRKFEDDPDADYVDGGVETDGDDDVDRTKESAKHGAIGVVLKNGQFRCHERLADGKMCLSKITNHPHHIGSHLSKMHKMGSSYQKGQESTNKRECDICHRQFKNANSLLSHMRDVHTLRAASRSSTSQPGDASASGGASTASARPRNRPVSRRRPQSPQHGHSEEQASLGERSQPITPLETIDEEDEAYHEYLEEEGFRDD